MGKTRTALFRNPSYIFLAFHPFPWGKCNCPKTEQPKAWLGACGLPRLLPDDSEGDTPPPRQLAHRPCTATASGKPTPAAGGRAALDPPELMNGCPAPQPSPLQGGHPSQLLSGSPGSTRRLRGATCPASKAAAAACCPQGRGGGEGKGQQVAEPHSEPQQGTRLIWTLLFKSPGGTGSGLPVG